MKRREAIKNLSVLPVAGVMGNNSLHSVLDLKDSKTAFKQNKSIYESIGVRPLINARGTVTIIGASRILPEVQKAMDEAVLDYVQIDELKDWEEKIIAERVYEVLSKPHIIKKPEGPPAFNISGQWDLEMKFSAGNVNQKLIIEQKENDISGTHFASIGALDLKGSIFGKEIMMRSSYTFEGVRINIEFTGIVDGDTIEGEASLCEYGTATWKALRHIYK